MENKHKQSEIKSPMTLSAGDLHANYSYLVFSSGAPALSRSLRVMVCGLRTVELLRNGGLIPYVSERREGRVSKPGACISHQLNLNLPFQHVGTQGRLSVGKAMPCARDVSC